MGIKAVTVEWGDIIWEQKIEPFKTPQTLNCLGFAHAGLEDGEYCLEMLAAQKVILEVSTI